jgi:hypothetical protein
LALALLALDALFGAAQYAGLGGSPVGHVHELLTGLVKSLGFALALAAVLAGLVAPRRRWLQAGVFAAVLVAGLLLFAFTPLIGPLLLAHVVAGVAKRRAARSWSFGAAAALLVAIVSQVAMGAGALRLDALHLSLAAWALAAAQAMIS